MRPLLITTLSLLLSASAFCQTKTITINYNSSLANGKKMTGINTGPQTSTGSAELCLQTIGNELIRTHDYYGPCDYNNYTDFYFGGSFNYSFQSHDPAYYNWLTTNSKMNSIVNASMSPFFRLGISMGFTQPLTPMPADADGVNFTKFAGICKRTAMHYNGGWDNGFNYGINYWEVWNEPNHAMMWTGTPSNYYQMFKQVVDSMNAYDPALKVGGPAAAKNAFYSGGIHFTINHDYVGNFMSFCQTNNVPLDFYSFHMYDKKNPYHARILTDTLAYFLNQYGFTNTELVISEGNVDDTTYKNSAKGCSYLASELISLVGSRLSKYIIYRGLDLGPLCNDDTGSASLTLNGYAYRFFNEVNDSTPLLLVSQGNEFNSDNILDSLNNLMVLTGKNASNDLVKILVSNHESVYGTINLNISNLPWSTGQQLYMKTEKVSGTTYTESTSMISSGSSVNVSLTNVTDASVYLITLRNASVSAIAEESKNEIRVFPNPASSELQLETDFVHFTVNLTDLCGKQVYSGMDVKKIDVGSLPAGTYFLDLNDQETGKKVRTIVIVQ